MTNANLDTMTAAEFEAYARERFGDDDLIVEASGVMLGAYAGSGTVYFATWTWSDLADKLDHWYNHHPLLHCDCGKCHECHERATEAAIDRVDGGE